VGRAYDCRKTNGIRWKRGWCDFGYWVADRRAPNYNRLNAPVDPIIVIRLPRYTVALLHPKGQRG
jgi:hypothetical protein